MEHLIVGNGRPSTFAKPSLDDSTFIRVSIDRHDGVFKDIVGEGAVAFGWHLLVRDVGRRRKVDQATIGFSAFD